MPQGTTDDGLILLSSPMGTDALTFPRIFAHTGVLFARSHKVPFTNIVHCAIMLTIELADSVVQHALHPDRGKPCILYCRDEGQLGDYWSLTFKLGGQTEELQRLYRNIVYLVDLPGPSDWLRERSFRLLEMLIGHGQTREFVKHLTIAGPSPAWPSPYQPHLRPSINFETVIMFLGLARNLISFDLGGLDWVPGYGKRGWQEKVPRDLVSLRIGRMHCVEGTSCLDLLELRLGNSWKELEIGDIHHMSPQTAARQHRVEYRVVEKLTIRPIYTDIVPQPVTLPLHVPIVRGMTHCHIEVYDDRQALCVRPVLLSASKSLRVLRLAFKTTEIGEHHRRRCCLCVFCLMVMLTS